MDLYSQAKGYHVKIDLGTMIQNPKNKSQISPFRVPKMIKKHDFAYLKNVTTIGIQDQLTLTDQVSTHKIGLYIFSSFSSTVYKQIMIL
jgi:hypothetical protein